MKKIVKLFEQFQKTEDFEDFSEEEIFGKDNDIKLGDKVICVSIEKALYIYGMFLDSSSLVVGNEYIVSGIRFSDDEKLIEIVPQKVFYNAKNFVKK